MDTPNLLKRIQVEQMLRELNGIQEYLIVLLETITSKDDREEAIKELAQLKDLLRKSLEHNK